MREQSWRQMLIACCIALSVLAAPHSASAQDEGAPAEEPTSPAPAAEPTSPPPSDDGANNGGDADDDDAGGDDGGAGEDGAGEDGAGEDGEDAEPEPPPPPQVPLQGVASGPVAAVDEDLRSALFAVDYLGVWYETTRTQPELSLIAVQGELPARQTLLDTIDDLVEMRETTSALLKASIDSAAQQRILDDDLEAFETHRAALVSDRETTLDRRVALEAALTTIDTALESTAVGLYVSDSVGSITIDDVAGYNDRQEIAVRVDVTLNQLFSQQADLQSEIDAANNQLDALDDSIALVDDEITTTTDALTGVEDTIETLGTEIITLAGERTAAETAIPLQIEALHDERLAALVAQLDISLVTLDAYVTAATLVPDTYPSCSIRWEMMAGISEIESNHGRFGGAGIGIDGMLSQRILGPVLDGSLENTAIIVDSDGGAMDGNAAFDRAVGPFQFLPSTWRTEGLDATGDGTADPHNMYDGALSAAGYLCSVSSMATDGNIEVSVLTYNQSRHYLASVTAAARRHIVAMTVPEADYDPETIVLDEGWRNHFDPAESWFGGADSPR